MSRWETKTLDGWICAVRYRSSIFERPAVRRIALACASLLFMGGGIFSLRARPALLDSLDLFALLGVLALVPFTVSANTAQFWLTGHLLGIQPQLKRAFTITVLSTAGNLLPLPGGAAVRIAALKKSGGGYLRPAGLTLLVGFFWMGLSSAIACGALLLLDQYGLALIAGGVSAVVIPVVLYQLVVVFGAGPKWIIALASAHLGLALVGSVRLWLCFQALGEPILFQQVLVLLFSSVIAAFVGVAPGGLGVIELSAAAIAGLIGVSAAVAFIAAAANQVTGFILIAPLALLLGALDSRFDRKAVSAKQDSGA